MIKLFNRWIGGGSLTKIKNVVHAGVKRTPEDFLKKRLLPLGALGLAGIGFFVIHQIGVVPAQAKHDEVLIVEVACDGRTSALNRADPSATTPARGDTGIVNGNIYPGGTIPPGFDDAFDLDVAPGRVGTWVCVNNRAALEPPRGSAVTYYFALPDFETAGLVTQGFNSHRRTGSIPVVHALVGATGKLSGVTGEVREEVIGTNKTGAFNLRYHIRIRK